MKSKLIKILVVAVVLVVIAGGFLFFSLNSVIQRGVVTVGPEVTKVPIELAGVNLSVFSGKGEIKGLVVGNPEGFKTPTAINVGSASLQISPASVLSDKIVIHSIRVEAPEITFEGSLSGSNLSKIQENVDAYVANLLGSAAGKVTSKSSKAGKKLQVDEFVISNAKVNLSLTILGGKSATIPLPEIRLADLGQGPEGITAAELIKKVTGEILGKTTTAVTGYLGDLGKGVTDAVKGVGGAAGDAAKGVTKGLGDLFKKK